LEGLEDRYLLTNQMSATAYYVPFVVNQPSGAILVAKVSDSGDLAPLSSHFTANVVWGDGTSSGGAIVPDPVVAGEFDVLASHLYTSTGYNQVIVGISNSVTDNTRQVSFNDPVTEPAPAVTAASTPTIAMGQTISNLPVATFTDADSALTTSSFSATVHWGDGDVSTGSIVADASVAGQFDVTASKPTPYAHAGSQAISVTVGVAGSQTPNTWAPAASLPVPTGPSGSLAAATSGSLLYAIGGYLGGNNTTTGVVQSYNPATNSWTSAASLPTARHALTAATGPNGEIYAIGGITAAGLASAEVDVYSPFLNSWTTTAPLPTARYYFEAATGPDGKIYAIGGETQGDVPSAEVDVYDPATSTWTTAAPLPTALGALAAATGPDGRIYAVGGNNGAANSSAVYAYDTSTNAWTQVASLPATISALSAATGPDGQIYASGGGNGNYLNTVYSYNVTSNSWAQVASLPTALQFSASATVSNGLIYNLGGYNSSTNFATANSYATFSSTGNSSINFTISKADPVITWSNPANITYGTALSGTQLDATALVPGTFVYTPAAGTILNAGASQTLSVTFTPTDTTDYNSVTQTATINVNPATPVLTWSNPANITYGTPLSGTQLNATASVPGTFTYTPAAGTILGAGAGQTLSVTFTPTDSVDYSSATTTVSLVVNPATPVLSWLSPADITYGTPLSGTQLDATANVPGTFIYAPPVGVILPAGSNQTLVVTFLPTDSVDYNPTTTSTTINVTKATPVISWASPADITYGTALSGTQLDATSSVPGSFLYTPNIGTVLNAGAGQTLSVTFTSTDTADYVTTTSTTTINVAKVTPVITWANPVGITYGTALSGIQLDATASVPGTFGYSPAAGTILGAGAGQTLSVTFTPTDSLDYTTATGSTTINVAKANPTITWANPANITYGTPLSGTQLNANANTAGTFVYTPAAGTILHAGANQTLSVVFTPTDTVDFVSATATALINVAKATPVITWPTPANIVYGTPLTGTQLKASSSAAGTFVYSPGPNVVLHAGAAQTLSVHLTPSDPLDFNATTATVKITVTPAPLTITAYALVRYYNFPNPALNVYYTGFVKGDGPASLTHLANVSTLATQTSLPGIYPIVVTGGSSPNYKITDENGTITIAQPPAAIQGYMAFVQTLYIDLLGRNADNDGLVAFVDQIEAGTPETFVLNEFVASTEYQNLQKAHKGTGITPSAAMSAALAAQQYTVNHPKGLFQF
jgi:N-acetylneuraminic acid mutarotase